MTPEPTTIHTTLRLDDEGTRFYTAGRCPACRAYHGTRPCTTN